VLLGCLGLGVAWMPEVWTMLFTDEPAVLQASATYFRWAGPFYGLFGLGLALYFASLGAGQAAGPVMAGTLRLVVVALGGSALALAQGPVWSIFALVGVGMAVYGISMVWFVRRTPWG
jgi:Na+-driven multidrug efflux pump